MNFDKFRDTALLNHLPWTVVKGVWVPVPWMSLFS